MSKIWAYVCDSCNELKLESEVVGIATTQDIYDTFRSFPIVNNPLKADLHCCTRCFTQRATLITDMFFDRNRDRDGWEEKYKELSYCLRKEIATRGIKKMLNGEKL